MQFDAPKRRGGNSSLLPMINVVFLLLIFFLISAKLSPPEPFPTEPPHSEAAAEAEGEFSVFLGAEGQLGFRDMIVAQGEDVDPLVGALVQAREEYCATTDCETDPAHLLLRGDQHVKATYLAGLLPKLGQAGFAKVELVTTRGGAE
ncbi:biopolymer transporter ExbD [Thioclava sp. GXIMD4216]|uniref:Biopolymer transporter ExbD n=1 Tax=Thioclava litoralis TaxID=3076557 RepID=A0ABZ1DVR9_9RHOB|nr:biopolymer transporter ExbD [Thioclava sp. FTW29]